LSFAIHALIIGALFWLGGVGRGGGPAGGAAAGAGGGARLGLRFFALPSAAPAAVDLPSAPRIPQAELPTLQNIPLDLPRVALAAPPRLAPRDTGAVDGGAGGGGAGGAGAGQGAGGAGVGAGSGTGGEGDYISVASPRTAILPPLVKLPGSVSGRTYRIRFWVAADGRVTKVDVEPPIADEAYRREFLERMMAYQFYPARTRDGVNVASVVTVPLRIGN